MVLRDIDIKAKGDRIIRPFSEESVYNIGYDLITDVFCIAKGKETKEITLDPGQSVFVKSEEEIELSSNMAAEVVLRNSRIRQGLALSAPIYQPGHHTRVFFRITNISKQQIHIGQGVGIASIMFHELQGDVEKPYAGAFADEMEYRDLGVYESTLGEDITDIEQKIDNLQEVEKRLYGNVMSIMAIFVGIFSLINVNVALIANKANAAFLLIANLSTVGAIAFLIAMMQYVFPKKEKSGGAWIPCAIAFLLAIIIFIIAK